MTIRHAGASLGGRLIGFATTTSIALMLGAASASAATVVKWMHVELDPKAVAVWEEIAKDYEAKHPDVDVQLQFRKRGLQGQITDVAAIQRRSRFLL